MRLAETWVDLGGVLLIVGMCDRSASSSSVVRCSLRARGRNHIPKLLVFSVWSLLSAYSTSVTEWHLSVVKLRLPKMLRYVYIYVALRRGTKANVGLSQNEYASILAKRVNEEKAKKTELRSKLDLVRFVGVMMANTHAERRASSMRK